MPAFIEAGINIIVSIILVQKFGLVGVAIGTICGMTYRMAYHVYFTTKLIEGRSQWTFYKKLLAFSAMTIVGTVTCKLIPVNQLTVLSWILSAIVYAFIIGVLYLILSLVFFKNEIKFFIKYLKK